MNIPIDREDSDSFVHLVSYKGEDIFLLPSLVKAVYPGMAGESVVNLGGGVTIAVKGCTGDIFGKLFGTSSTNWRVN